MNGIELIKTRRSVRNFKEEIVPHAVMEEVIEIARFAPSWSNFQVARYTFVTNPDMISRFASDAVHGFVYNIKSLKNAKNVAILSFVKGKSGKLDAYEGLENISSTASWETFDAGIACQTFCLAAHAKGIGTCIMGVINNDIISSIAGLPEGETVAALIVYGYPGKETKIPPRKEVSEIVRFID